MADQQNVQLIRDVYDAFGKRDMDAVGNALAADILYRVPGRNPLAGDRESTEAFFEFLGQVAEQTSGTFRLEVRDVFGRAETVVALVAYRAERNGKTFSGDAIQVWRVENGKVVDGRVVYYDPYGMDEFWL